MGRFIGSALGGILVDKLKLFCDLMIAVSLDGGAIATLGVPWVPKTELIWFLSCLQGCFAGVINIGNYQLTNSHIISTFMAPQLPNYLGMLPKVLDFKFCLNQKFLVLIKKAFEKNTASSGSSQIHSFHSAGLLQGSAERT